MSAWRQPAAGVFMAVFRAAVLVLPCQPMLSSAAVLDAADTKPQSSLEPVTVTATRNPTSTFDFPGMVDVLDQRAIDAAIPSTISDLVENMPNVQFAGGPRRTGESPNIRGLGGQDVLILIDGVRQGWTSGHDGRFSLDPALLSSVEVVRGPASALYGSGALGGVMAFRTADASDFLTPGQTAGARVALGYQGVDDDFLRTTTGFAHWEDFDFIGSIGQRTSGDIKLGSGSSLAADDDIVTGFAKIGYSRGETFSVKVSYQRFKNDAVEPDDGQGLTTGAPVDKTIDTQQYSGEIVWKPASAGFVDLHLTPYHVHGSVEEIDPATQERTLRDIKTDGVSADNRLRFNFTGGSGLLTVGGEWYRDTQIGSDSLGAGGMRSGVPDGEDSFWGAFAQLETTLDRPLGAPGRLSLIPAARYDSYRTSSAGNADFSRTAFSPKLAVSYAPVEWLSFFGNGGKAFRAPGVNDLYLNGVHFAVPHPILSGVSVANTFTPNPNLRPEESVYWEAGAGLQFGNLFAAGDSLRLKASYWNQHIDDFISLNVFTPPTFYSPGCFTPPTFLVDCNVGMTTASNVDADLHGAEFEALYDTDRWRLQLDYGTISGHERGTAYDLSSLMPNRVSAVATLKIPAAAASLSVRAESAGDFRKNYDPASNDPSTETRGGYTLLEFFATWEPGEAVLGGRLRGLRLDAGVGNATNKNYEPYQAGVSAPGRNFKVLASYTLGR